VTSTLGRLVRVGFFRPFRCSSRRVAGADFWGFSFGPAAFTANSETKVGAGGTASEVKSARPRTMQYRDCEYGMKMECDAGPLLLCLLL
jgi:hypothetical protein